jgi:hypothetical protein
MTSQVFTSVSTTTSSCEALKSSTICSSTSPSASVYPCQKVIVVGPSVADWVGAQPVRASAPADTAARSAVAVFLIEVAFLW